MDTILSAMVGIALVVVFLLYYAIILKSIPLWLIMVFILGMAVVDFYQSAVKSENNAEG